MSQSEVVSVIPEDVHLESMSSFVDCLFPYFGKPSFYIQCFVIVGRVQDRKGETKVLL